MFGNKDKDKDKYKKDIDKLVKLNSALGRLDPKDTGYKNIEAEFKRQENKLRKKIRDYDTIVGPLIKGARHKKLRGW